MARGMIFGIFNAVCGWLGSFGGKGSADNISPRLPDLFDKVGLKHIRSIIVARTCGRIAAS